MVKEECHRIIWLVLHANLNQCFGRGFASWVSFGSSSSGPTISSPALKRLREVQDILYTGHDLWAPVATLYVLDSFTQPFREALMKCPTLSIPVGALCNELTLYPSSSFPGLVLALDDVQSFCIKWKEHLTVDFCQLTSLSNSSPLLFLPVTSLAFSLISAHHHLDLIMSYIIKNPGTTCKYPTQGRTS